MGFVRTILRDVILYTIPFVLARVVLFPIINLNSKLQNQYRKVEEENNLKDKYQKYQNFTVSQKKNCIKEIITLSGYKGLYEKWGNYVIPYAIARTTEGIASITFRRMCLDIFKWDDPFYLLTSLTFFIVSLVGAFFLRLTRDIIRENKNYKSAIGHISLSNSTFWKQFEADLGFYHAYTLIQRYIELFSFWYFRPGLYLAVFLYAISRIIASIICQPLSILAHWATEHNFDHVKLLQGIVKRDGKLGLYAGVRDNIFNEIVISCVLIPGVYFLSKFI